MCICTRAWPAVTCTSCSMQQLPLTAVGLWTLAQHMLPNVTPSRIDLTVSGSSWVVTQLSTCATVLSHPFWYSNSKLNCARPPTHQWPVASKLSVVIMYVNGLFSVFTRTTFSIPYHQWKGLGFKKGICVWCTMPWASLPGAPLAWPPWLEGSRLPSPVLSPPFSSNGWLFWMPSPIGIHG